MRRSTKRDRFIAPNYFLAGVDAKFALIQFALFARPLFFTLLRRTALAFRPKATVLCHISFLLSFPSTDKTNSKRVFYSPRERNEGSVRFTHAGLGGSVSAWLLPGIFVMPSPPILRRLLRVGLTTLKHILSKVISSISRIEKCLDKFRLKVGKYCF